MAPSIYEYRSAAEWEQAMQEWCDAFEPRIFVQYEADGEKHPCTTFEEGRTLCAAYHAEHPESHPRIRIEEVTEPHGSTYIRFDFPYGEEDIEVAPEYYEQKYRAGDRPGGTRSEYRALGLR